MKKKTEEKAAPKTSVYDRIYMMQNLIETKGFDIIFINDAD